MSTNGNGWFHSYWKGPARAGNPTKPGWYAARPECCEMTVKVLVYPNLFEVYVEGQELKYDIYDFEWWHKLKSEHDRLPEF